MRHCAECGSHSFFLVYSASDAQRKLVVQVSERLYTRWRSEVVVSKHQQQCRRASLYFAGLDTGNIAQPGQRLRARARPGTLPGCDQPGNAVSSSAGHDHGRETHQRVHRPLALRSKCSTLSSHSCASRASHRQDASLSQTIGVRLGNPRRTAPSGGVDTTGTGYKYQGAGSKDISRALPAGYQRDSAKRRHACETPAVGAAQHVLDVELRGIPTRGKSSY